MNEEKKDVLKKLGGTHEFEHKGKIYHVSPITYRVRLDFERKQYRSACEAARNMRECDLMTKEEYSGHLQKLNDNYISGQYSLVSDFGAKSLQTPKGIVLLCSLLFNCDENEMLDLMIEREQEVTSLIDIIIKESSYSKEKENVN